MTRWIAALGMTGLISLAPSIGEAQQKQSQEAIAAKCRAQVRKAMPNAHELAQRAQAQRLMGQCIRNGGKL